MRRKINAIRYIGVLILTILIFTIGIFLGGMVEGFRVQNLYTQLQEQDLDYQNVLTEGNYLNYIVSLKENNLNNSNNVSCDLIRGAYFTSIKNLYNSRLKLENYINTGSVKEKEFSRLKEHYANVQINYWILANRISNLCDGNLNTILYFYQDEKKCPSCEDQGVHLSYVKAKLKDEVMIFSLDLDRIGPTQLLAQKYGAYERESPILVINEEVYGFSTNSEIFDILNVNN